MSSNAAEVAIAMRPTRLGCDYNADVWSAPAPAPITTVRVKMMWQEVIQFPVGGIRNGWKFATSRNP